MNPRLYGESDPHSLPRADDPHRVFANPPSSAPLPRFVITKEVIDAMEYDETIATLEALQECKALAMPYPRFWLSFNFADYAKARGWGEQLAECQDIQVTAEITDNQFAIVNREILATLGQYIWQVDSTTGNIAVVDLINRQVVAMNHSGAVALFNPPGFEIEKFAEEGAHGCLMMAGLLVAALATKNIKKHTKFNKRAARGHGNGDLRGPGGVIYLSRTVLELPDDYDTATGRRMKFHLRRGHVHTFLTGPGRTTPVKKFVDAVLVNRDLQDGATPPTQEYVVR